MTRPPPSQPLDALWRPDALIWVLIAGEGLALILSMTPGLGLDRRVYFGLASLAIQWVALFTLGSLYLMRRLLRNAPPASIGIIALLLAVIHCWALFFIASVVLQGPRSYQSPDWNELALQACGIAIIFGVLGLLAFQNFWRGRIHAVRAKQFELEALQARIRPHFLFNTLNTGAALVHLRPADAEQLLLDLADLFRAALAGPQEIELADELALTRRYLEIEAMRFGERLQVDWHLPDALPQAMIPTLSVQPLVENAIRHGIEPSPDGGSVAIEVAEGPDWIEIVIRNALPASATRTKGHRIGLDSVRARIDALTQGRGQLETQVVDDCYVATIRLPLQERTEGTRPGQR